jgi:hypothetical protein
MIYERNEPGKHWDEENKLNPLWVLGLQLPNSYDRETLSSFDEIMRLVELDMADIFVEAKSMIGLMIDEVVSPQDTSILVTSAPKCM